MIDKINQVITSYLDELRLNNKDAEYKVDSIDYTNRNFTIFSNATNSSVMFSYTTREEYNAEYLKSLGVFGIYYLGLSDSDIVILVDNTTSEEFYVFPF